MKHEQIEMVSLEELVPADHSYRQFLKYFDFHSVAYRLRKLEKNEEAGARGYGLDRLFRCLLLQFVEDLSDRELEKMLQENNAAKLFCDFRIKEKTPDYSLFSKTRKKIGTKVLGKMFAKMRDQLKSHGYMNEVFNFVDASHLVSKANLWEERDKAIKEKYDKLNNETLSKVAVDTQARIGCKGGNKFWYGYKEHVSVDMQSGFINKVAITPANVTDAQGLSHVCPNQGALYGDKGYCIKPARETMKRKGIHDATIKLNHMKVKNRDIDRWHSHLRAPYERVFSQRPRRVRYRGIEKNQFAGFMRAMVFNMKRMLQMESPPEKGLALA